MQAVGVMASILSFEALVIMATEETKEVIKL